MGDSSALIRELLRSLRLLLDKKERSIRLDLDTSAVENDIQAVCGQIAKYFDDAGWDRAQYFVESEMPLRHCPAVLTHLARLCRFTRIGQALVLGRRAYAMDPRPSRAKWLGFVEFDGGNISEAARLLESLPKSVEFKESERRRRMQIAGSKRLLSRLPDIPPLGLRDYKAEPRTMLYVAASCQPFHVSGYTIRTQALLKAASNSGWKVHCVTRPGYPWDRRDSLLTPSDAFAHCDGIDYHLIRGTDVSTMAPDAYIDTAAALIEAAARQIRPAIIVAGSNHMNALPALIAARRMGVPFVYEVRGLWELSFASSRPGWEQTERFKLSSRLEGLAACNAHAVFTLTSQLSTELQKRGVEKNRIYLLPNGGESGLSESVAVDKGLLAGLGLDPSVFTIGYAGAIKYYEGLDDLLVAMAQLRQDGRRIQAVIAGDGDWLPNLLSRCADLNLGSCVRFTGKLSLAEARRYLRASDMGVVPRKRLDVGETVSPLKPFEFMTLGVPLLMSNVAPLLTIAEGSRQAVALFEASNPASFANEIARLMDGPDLRQDLSRRALEFIALQGSWDHVAKTMSTVLDAVQLEFHARDRTPFRRLQASLHQLSRFVGKVNGHSARLASEITLLANSDLFDANWYLKRYPDVARSGMSPIVHYLVHGAREKRNPGPNFNTSSYIVNNARALADGINPLVHYLKQGQKAVAPQAPDTLQ